MLRAAALSTTAMLCWRGRLCTSLGTHGPMSQPHRSQGTRSLAYRVGQGRSESLRMLQVCFLSRTPTHCLARMCAGMHALEWFAATCCTAKALCQQTQAINNLLGRSGAAAHWRDFHSLIFSQSRSKRWSLATGSNLVCTPALHRLFAKPWPWWLPAAALIMT